MRGHGDVVERFAPQREIHVRNRQPLQQTHERRQAEGRDRDGDVHQREGVAALHFTTTLPTIAWCINPQYSLHAIVCSPGVSNVTVTCVT